MRLSAFLHCTQ